MDYAIFMDGLSQLLMVAAMLVAVTNIIVEVLKVALPKVSGNYLAIGTALAVTIAAFAVWLSWAQIAFEWYYIPAVLVMGMMVAYAAMFGFDKLKETFEGMKK